jgi:hypothetical protein
MTLDEIDFWVGQGANRAALAIDWNDADTAAGRSERVKVWGFRWDGQATGADMVQAVCRADSSLYAMGSLGGWGFAIGGLGYDTSGDGAFDITKSGAVSRFDADGYMTVAGYAFDGWTSADAADSWAGGWEIDGFWGYSYVEAGSSTWTSSMIGASVRLLTDGTWDGWSWGAAANGWYGGDPSVTVAIPEPATLMLCGVGGFFIGRRK